MADIEKNILYDLEITSFGKEVFIEGIPGRKLNRFLAEWSASLHKPRIIETKLNEYDTFRMLSSAIHSIRYKKS